MRVHPNRKSRQDSYGIDKMEMDLGIYKMDCVEPLERM